MSWYKKEQIQTYNEILLGSFRKKNLKVEEREDHELEGQEGDELQVLWDIAFLLLHLGHQEEGVQTDQVKLGVLDVVAIHKIFKELDGEVEDTVGQLELLGHNQLTRYRRRFSWGNCRL